MKKLFKKFVLIILLFASIFLVSWTVDVQNSIKVKIVNNSDEMTIITKDGKLDKDNIPLYLFDPFGIYNFELYLDSDYKTLYLDEELVDGQTLYVKATLIKFLEEDVEMITYDKDSYSILDNEYGIEFSFNRKNSIFECNIDEGSFDFYKEEKKVVKANKEKIYFTSNYFKDLEKTDYVSLSNGYTYIDVIVKEDDNITGYGIIKLEIKDNGKVVEIKEVVSKLFPKIDGKYQDVTANYVNNKIEVYKNNESKVIEVSDKLDKENITRQILILNPNDNKDKKENDVKIKMSLEADVYLCETEYSSFSDVDEVRVKELKANDELIYYFSYDKVGTPYEHVNTTEKVQFVNIIKIKNNNIIGFDIVGIGYSGSLIYFLLGDYFNRTISFTGDVSKINITKAYVNDIIDDIMTNEIGDMFKMLEEYNKCLE